MTTILAIMIGNDDSAQNLSDSNLHIQCTATEVNATFEYSGSKSNFDRRITSLYNDITWICQVRFVCRDHKMKCTII